MHCFNTKTNIGATAFSACTNKLPNSMEDCAKSLETRERSIPKKIPMAICITRLRPKTRSSILFFKSQKIPELASFTPTDLRS